MLPIEEMLIKVIFFSEIATATIFVQVNLHPSPFGEFLRLHISQTLNDVLPKKGHSEVGVGTELLCEPLLCGLSFDCEQPKSLFEQLIEEFGVFDADFDFHFEFAVELSEGDGFLFLFVEAHELQFELSPFEEGDEYLPAGVVEVCEIFMGVLYQLLSEID